MSWTDGIDDGGFGEFGGGYAGSPVDASVSGFGADLDGSYGGGVSISGPVGPSSQSGEDARDESNNPTNSAGGRPAANFNTATLVGNMRNAANRVGSFLSNLSPTMSIAKGIMSMVPEDMRAPTYGVMSLPGYQGLAENLGYDPNLAQAYGATTGVPYGFDEAMQNVPVVGSGAHLGLATSIESIGGKNVHMGPGFMMDENNYPGYGVNPVTGVAMADPGDPYIRRRRGTEIAAMIGP